MKRIGVLALVLAGIVLFAAASPSGSVRAAPPPDACGTAEVDVPDSGDSFNFYTACLNHDNCYAAGGGPLARARCDSQFLRDMNAWCDNAWSQSDPRWGRCRLVAITYYSAVRIGGWLYFYS